MIANGLHRRNTIPFLWDGERLLDHPATIRAHVDGFYKELFSSSTRCGLSLDPDIWSGPRRVPDAANAALLAPFSEEVLSAIKGMNPASALGPDSLSVKFFQVFWTSVKAEIIAMFQEFYVGTLDLFRLNYGIITLIPKVPGASDIRQFRPITVKSSFAFSPRCTPIGRPF